LSHKELSALIKSNFPKLDVRDISVAAEQLVEFDRAELETVLHPGKFINENEKGPGSLHQNGTRDL